MSPKHVAVHDVTEDGGQDPNPVVETPTTGSDGGGADHSGKEIDPTAGNPSHGSSHGSGHKSDHQ